MKTLREQIIQRVGFLGGEPASYYENVSDYDLIEDYENLLRNRIEEELTKARSNDIMDLNE